VFLRENNYKIEIILTKGLQVQLNNKLEIIMQKMCKMMHSGTCDEDAPKQQEYDDVEEDNHDQQEAPVPDSPPVAPFRRSN
jgi:hypothetical protein